MNDGIIEKIVTKQTTIVEWLMRVGVVLIALIVSFIAFAIPMISIFAPILVAGLLFLAWLVLGRTFIEYEYSFTEGDLNIDAIYRQRKRKKIVTVNLKDRLDFMAPVNTEDKTELNKNVNTVLYLASSKNCSNAWFINTRDEKGTKRIFFEPNERMVDAIRRCAPSKVKLN